MSRTQRCRAYRHTTVLYLALREDPHTQPSSLISVVKMMDAMKSTYINDTYLC
jgi:hypothetical protein